MHIHGATSEGGTLNAGSHSPFSLISIVRSPQHPESLLSHTPELWLPRPITELSEVGRHKVLCPGSLAHGGGGS